jgi:REP element-mobilizing transposase RayT
MSLINDPHKELLRAAGWRTRGYLPHFDGRAVPQFLTLRLSDSIPTTVIEQWRQELAQLSERETIIVMQRRIEHYLDQGYGECLLKIDSVATMVENSLLKFDKVRYDLFAWVVMPNHTHSLFTRFEDWNLERLMQAHKSYTAHEANKLIGRKGQFWMEDYFDRYIRNDRHFRNTVKYIENNPVKAGLCAKPSDWPFSSAWFREHGPSRSAGVPARTGGETKGV